MNTRYIRLSAVLAAAIALTACSFSSLDVEKKAHDYGYNVADENGYIKSFNVGTAAKVEPETKTKFHTEKGSYGLTTWEQGLDKLSFIKRDPNGIFSYMNNSDDWQVFDCESTFSRDNDIKWAKFTVSDGKIGLNVGENYYAYYMNGNEETAINKFLGIADFKQNGQSDESLQNFMRNYDFLILEDDQHDGNAMENNGIVVESPMKDVYMMHYFSLIEVDVHWTGDIMSKDKSGHVSLNSIGYPFKSVQFGSGDDWKTRVSDNKDDQVFIPAFAGRVSMDGYGELKLSNPTTFVTNNRNDIPDLPLYLSESNNILKYYLLVHPVEPSNHYWIKVLASDPSGDKAVTIHYELPELFSFKPGYYYLFDINADFSGMTDSDDPRFWQDQGRLFDINADELLSKGIKTYYENN